MGEQFVEYTDVDPGEVFICEGVSVESILTAVGGGPLEPRVRVQLHGRWNHGNVPAFVTAVMSPETARECGPWFPEAADAAERDLTVVNAADDAVRPANRAERRRRRHGR